ncbi:potassium-transporting ATPase subunit KdpC [Cohnella sp.]|uniref:potassium-transporting ATPase subunit KdpC n=1 Tax=Cohnella sp. TaxID=1883426 RepID=UPI003565AFDE
MRVIVTSFRISLALMIFCGLLYNLAVTGIAQAVMPERADGSLIYNEQGQLIGSELIGQSFNDPSLFHGRESSIGYSADGSGSPNYAPSNTDMFDRVQLFVQNWEANNPDVPIGEVPVDLMTNSGSGLDPHISPDAAKVQIPRIAQKTGIAIEQLESLVVEYTDSRELGILGEPTVNVLKLNMALQRLMSS